MSEVGWIKLWRRLREHWTWKKKPFGIGQAWVDLVLRCNYEEKAIPNPGQIGPAMLQPGEAIVSLRGLERDWGWHRGKVIRFLKTLKNDTMIVTTNCHQYTLLKVLNYSGYQTSDVEVTPPDVPQMIPRYVPPRVPPIAPILRSKESEEVKKKRTVGHAARKGSPSQGAQPPGPPKKLPDPGAVAPNSYGVNAETNLHYCQNVSPAVARRLLRQKSIAFPPEALKILEATVKADDDRLNALKASEPKGE